MSPRRPIVPKWMPCEWCGEDFKRRNRTARFCSNSCSASDKATRRDFSGRNNPRYRGGLSESEGRTIIVCRDYSWIFFYRGVMEAHIGRELRDDEIVHHKNGDPTDDRIENLELTTRAAHIEMHRDELLAARELKRAAA